MATVRAIFQPLAGGQQHAPQLVSLAGEPWLDRLIISSAFSNSAGVAAVSTALAPVAGVCRAFIGVRNGSTTAQATAALLKLGVELYALDTATRSRIFHPKAFIATGSGQARAIVGSANLTHAGLFNNIEAGTDIELDLADASDKAFVDTMLDGFDDLMNKHPQHCFQINSGRQIIDLMKQGILEDERNPKTQTTFGSGKQGAATSKPPINLPSKSPPVKPRSRKPKVGTTTPAANTSAAPPIFGQVVWAKPNLRETDLKLNAGHTAAQLRLTQARYKVNGTVIDQTTYFRNQVFAGLNWTFNTAANKDEAVAPISLVIAGVHVGDFDLQLSHKPAWAAGQGNYTTGLHWGNASSHIKHRGLLGRTLTLYQPSTAGARYVIEIN